MIVDLPQEENEHFQLRKYGLYALKHTYNRGIIFRDFRVPAENLLTPPRGDGLTIAYHGLNLGRIALCANAAGTMRIMMAEHDSVGQFPPDLRRRRSPRANWSGDGSGSSPG